MAIPSFLTTRPAFLTSLSGKRDTLNHNADGVSRDIRNLLAKTTIVAPVGIGQIDAFLFDWKGDEMVTVCADVTDHWMEDNTVSSDHIGVKPVEISMRGFIAEVSLESGFFNNLNAILQGVSTGLVRSNALLGKYAPGATDKLLKVVTDVQNIALQIERALQTANSILNFLLPGPQFNKQQAAFNKLSALVESRHLNTVYTPFKVYNNMVITSLKATQKGDSRMVSDFVINMKQMRFVGELIQYEATFAGRSANDNQTQTLNGATAGTEAPSSDVIGASLKGTTEAAP